LKEISDYRKAESPHIKTIIKKVGFYWKKKNDEIVK